MVSAVESVSLSDLSILLIEPSDTQRKIIVKQLKAQGIVDLAEATTKAQALEMMNTHPRDLIASSMYFEDGSAIELLNEIRNHNALSDTPFMLVSSEIKRKNLEAYKQAGVVAILPKPFESRHLKAALKNTVDNLNVEEMELELFDVHDIRVLLVDDSNLARKHIKRVLNNLGLIKVTEAADGQEAINILAQEMFDLVVTDYNMPEVDGRELAKFIRNDSQQSHLPILMVTSESNDTHLANIAQDGVDALCDKPFETQYVKKLLFNLLDHD